MSPENVEIVRRIYEAWNSDDLGLELFDPSFELRQTATMLDSACQRVADEHADFLREAVALVARAALTRSAPPAPR